MRAPRLPVAMPTLGKNRQGCTATWKLHSRNAAASAGRTPSSASQSLTSLGEAPCGAGRKRPVQAERCTPQARVKGHCQALVRQPGPPVGKQDVSYMCGSAAGDGEWMHLPCPHPHPILISASFRQIPKHKGLAVLLV
jgi:hypothetical protein